MPRALIGKVDNMQEQMGKERNETLKKWKEILIIKSTVTEMNAFDRLIRKKRGRNIRNIWSNNDWEFSKINDRHQTTRTESLQNVKYDKYQKSIPRHIIF